MRRSNRKKKGQAPTLTNSQIVKELDELDNTALQTVSTTSNPQLILVENVGEDVQTSPIENLDTSLESNNVIIPINLDSIQIGESRSIDIGGNGDVSVTDFGNDMRDPDYDPSSELLDPAGQSRIATRKTNNSTAQKIINKGTKGGRPRDEQVWDAFTITKVGKKRSATCKDCGELFKWAKVERLRSHLEVCSKGDDVCTRTATQRLSPSPEPGASPSIQERNKKAVSQQSIPEMFRRTESLKCKIDRQVAKFIYACNIPFAVVDHPEFIKLVRVLRPTYKPPNAKSIGGPMLNEVHDEIVWNAKQLASSKFATLMQDGWTGMQQAPVISHCISVEGKSSIFVNAIATTNDVKDAAYCALLANEAIEEAEKKFGCRIGAIVTDNCSTMTLMRTLMTNTTELWTYGCHTHWLNLVGKEIAETGVIEKVKIVQHYFRDITYARETLRQLGGLQAILPCETRWNTQYFFLENFVKNHTIYLDLVKDSKAKTPANVSLILTDLNFFQSVKNTMIKMEPVKDAIVKLQHEKSSVADAVSHWVNISKVCELDTVENCKFKDRMTKALTLVVCAAYLLDPYYRGEGLPSEFQEKGQAWLANKNPLFELAQLKLEAGDTNFYIKRLMNKDILRGELPLTTSQWWDIMGTQMDNKLPVGFAQLAKELMMLPASTSSIERCFSTMGSIITKTRNRIAVEKAGKLCMIYRSLNCGRLVDNDDNVSE